MYLTIEYYRLYMSIYDKHPSTMLCSQLKPTLPKRNFTWQWEIIYFDYWESAFALFGLGARPGWYKEKNASPLSPLHLSVNNTLARNIEKHGLAVQGSDFWSNKKTFLGMTKFHFDLLPRPPAFCLLNKGSTRHLSNQQRAQLCWVENLNCKVVKGQWSPGCRFSITVFSEDHLPTCETWE